MHKIDCERNKWLAEDLKTHSAITGIIRTYVPEEENHGVDDIWFSAITISNNLFGGPMENKTLKGKTLKDGDEWREWYSTDNPDGIMRWLSGAVPSGKNIFFVNAEDKYGNKENGKWYKLTASAASLCFMAVDGYLLFSPHSLKKAFLGYAWFLNRYHTEEYNKQYSPHWELKAILDLDQGTYIRSAGPPELYN